MALRNQPYLPLYVQDFLTDEKLAYCSASATGVYIRVMCLMHKSEKYGTILLKQNFKQVDKQVDSFALQLAKQLPYDITTIQDALNELIGEGVLYFDGDLLVQKRMVKDSEISELRKNAGKIGGKTTQNKIKNFDSNFALAKIEANTENEIEDIIVINEVSNEVSNIIDKAKKKKNSPVKRTELAKAMSDDEFVREMANKEIYPCLKHDSPLVLLSAGHWEQLKKRFPVEGLLIEMVKVYNNWKLKKGGVKAYVNDFAGVQEAWIVDNAMKILNAKNSFTYDKMRKQQLISDDIRQNNPTIVYHEPKQPE